MEKAGYKSRQGSPFQAFKKCCISFDLKYKGEHLADREYKEDIGSIWGGLNEKYKFMMVTKSDIEAKINSIKTL